MVKGLNSFGVWNVPDPAVSLTATYTAKANFTYDETQEIMRNIGEQISLMEQMKLDSYREQFILNNSESVRPPHPVSSRHFLKS